MKKSECEFVENCDLTLCSSARLPSFAKAAVYPDNQNKFISLISMLNDRGIPYVLIGGMSNLLIKNHIYNGVVIKTNRMITKNLAESKITLECGVRMSGIIRQMASDNLGGMEGLAGIPGTVGGMVRQNAGAFGYEISDRFQDALCYIPAEGRVSRFSKDEMNFSYRASALSEKKSILISATFDLMPKKREEILAKIRELRAQRSETQPTEFPSLGSVFKRHNGVGAGFYIDKAGLKGFSIGGAVISKKHAGFIVNTGGATADDFLRLIDYIKNRVYAVFGIELIEEIEII